MTVGQLSSALPAAIRDALARPAGARFYRCALQVNPATYEADFRGSKNAVPDTKKFARELMDHAVTNDIEVIALTDHNNVDSVEVMREAACQRGIFLFPGFEVRSSEGIHVICLYEPGTPVRDLERFLGEFGIRKTGPSADLSDKPFLQVLPLVRDQGGIAIAAHATTANGLLTVLTGDPRVAAWRSPDLLAIQIPASVEALPQQYRQIVQNSDPACRRDHPVAVINGADVKSADDLDDAAATSWIKMSDVSIEGLRQAFLDPESRIRLASNKPAPPDYAEIEVVAWQSGFLDGEAIHLNDNLNTLVGGRGTGKSTLIESIRYALTLEPRGAEAANVHNGIVRNVLGPGTKISLLIRSHRPGNPRYVIERTVLSPATVRDENGTVLTVAPSDVIPGVEIYGQHEISELAKSPEKLTLLLERFVRGGTDFGRRKSELRRALEQSRLRLLEARRELDHVDERLAALPRIEQTLKEYQDAGLETKLREQTLLVREEQVLRGFAERLEPFARIAEEMRRELPIDTAFVSDKALNGLPAQQLLRNLEPILDTVSNRLGEIAKSIDEMLARANADAQPLRAQWEERRKTVQRDYEKILRDLQRTKINAEEFMQLKRQLEELQPLRERRALLVRNVEEFESRRRQIIAEWEDIKQQEYVELQRAARKMSKALDGQVRVEPRFAGNREPLVKLLRDKLGGRTKELIDSVASAPDLSIPDLVRACREGAESLRSRYGLTKQQAERLCAAGPELVMQIEETDLPATTIVSLNVAARGQAPEYKPLDDLSTGQKATAVLFLLLLESPAPLIVDQPEDDLDNRFIMEGIVPKMREEKRRRQFLFATHNANIPVLGDAELIIGLQVRDGRGEIPADHLGSIDSPPVQRLVEEILEGGREAFEMRRRKYNF